MRIFLSWSGSRSREVAGLLHSWIPNVLPTVEPWMSEYDIPPGGAWALDIQEKLSKSKMGILCLTADNYKAPWILFEAGALSKLFGEASVLPYLIDLEPGKILPLPLGQFHGAEATYRGTSQLVSAINRILGEKSEALPAGPVQKNFERWWPELYWSLRRVSAPTQEKYFQLVNSMNGRCLEVAGANKENKAQIQMGDHAAVKHQMWSVHEVESGYYCILAKHSKKCLDVAKGSTGEGDPVHQYEYRRKTNQQWAFRRDHGFIRIEARHSGMFLDVNESNVIQNRFQNNQAQLWSLQPTFARET